MQWRKVVRIWRIQLLFHRLFSTGRWKTHFSDEAWDLCTARELHVTYPPVICNHGPMGPGNSGDIDFSLCKARVYAQHCGDIFMVKALFKSRWVTVKLPLPVWAWKHKHCDSTALRGQCRRDTTVVSTKNKNCGVQNWSRLIPGHIMAVD